MKLHIMAILVMCMGGGMGMFAMDKPKGFIGKVKEVFKLTPEKATQELRALIDSKSHGRLTLKKVTELVKAGADVNIQNKEGVTLLEMAIEVNNGPLVAYLLEKGANPNIGVPLARAARYNKTKIVAELIKKGASPNQYQDGRVGALWQAIYHGNLELVGILLAAKADVNMQTANGTTPLHMALQYFAPEGPLRNDSIGIIKLLLSHGADITQADSSGQTPLEMARKLNDGQVIKLFTMQRKQKLL